MRSTERVARNEVTTYEALGDPRWKGRLCLRSGTSEYNVSFVADRLAKDGRAATERMLRRWMANDPRSSAPTPTCSRRSPTATATSGLTNYYYLGRELEEDPDFPVARLGRPARARHPREPLGLGVVRGSDQPRRPAS